MWETTFNVEVKARYRQLEKARRLLGQMGARPAGHDVQIDTYFHTPNGRLKLREGRIENSLIFYRRPNRAGPKVSRVSRFDMNRADTRIRNVLAEALGVQVVVRKSREIYFLENVKIHLDRVDGLGSFLEIEAIDATGQRMESYLEEQCRTVMNAFSVRPDDLIENSYSDLLCG